MQQTNQPLFRPAPRTRAAGIARLIGPALVLALALAMTPAPQAGAAPGAGAAAKTASLSVAATHPRMRRVFRNRVMQVSRSKRGAPYRYGASGPRAFDCSGYTSWVYRKAGRRIPRTSRQQARASRRIRARDRRRGDLVFFHSRGRVYHVGIYAGHGRIWHAPSTGKRVRRQRIWTRSHFYGRFR